MKKNTLNLDIDLQGDTWEGIAIILFHSVAPSYAFVDDLNHLYDLSLARVDDLDVDGHPWPLFSFNDPIRQLRYYLVERPASAIAPAPLWTPGHKALILIGQQAQPAALSIHNEFSSATTIPDPLDILAARHAALLDELRSNFTTTTLLDPTAPLSSKNIKPYTELFELANTILDTLDVKYICDN